MKLKAIEYPEKMLQRVKSIMKDFRSADKWTESKLRSKGNVQRTEAGRGLPEYYLCYFLFVDILSFRDSGRAEKIDWSIPIEYNQKIFWIEYRKLGLGLFSSSNDFSATDANEIVRIINNAVRVASPLFEKMADSAIKTSNLNVTNNHSALFSRYKYFLQQYYACKPVDQPTKNEMLQMALKSGQTLSNPELKFSKDARWLALACIDAFFSWTEHVFILLAIINGNATTGTDVSELAEEEWSKKFKGALGFEMEYFKTLYDKLITIKKQLRNFVAHGAFGKNGEAFSFHSRAGAVPLLLSNHSKRAAFTFSRDLAFKENDVIEVLQEFIERLWINPLVASAKPYLDSGLPLILTYTTNGKYERAMASIEAMEELIEELTERFDRAKDMDW